MRRLDNRSLRLDADEILAFVCVRDEALRLPWFLEYYRQAGVDHFFVVDNGSSDGSTDYLLSQPDVFLYGSSGFLVGGTGRGAASWVTGGRSVDRSSASRARLTLVLETRVPSCYPLSLV